MNGLQPLALVAGLLLVAAVLLGTCAALWLASWPLMALAGVLGLCSIAAAVLAVLDVI